MPREGVSHDPEISKRVLLRDGEIPHVTTFAQARFRPGQVCTPHLHPTMIEVYLVESGHGTITVEERDQPLEAGMCVVAAAGETHSVANTGEVDLVLTYFGIAVDDDAR